MFSGLDKYHKSDPADSKLSSMYGKDTVNMNNRVFAHRRASTSSVPSPLDVRVITHNGLSPSRRSIQSFRPVSRNSYKHQNNHSNSNTFLAIHDRDLVS